MAITLEELVVELRAENQQFMATMRDSLKSVEDSSNKMAKEFGDFAKESQKSAGTFRRAWETAIGFVTGQAIISAFQGVANAARGFFRTLIVDGMEAAQVQERAENRLAQALARTGQFTRETNREMQEYASTLQSVSTVGDEVILENMALIQSLGQLSTDGLKSATSAALDMAAALDMDLRTASQMIGRAAQGNISLFQRYGITIKEGATEAETLANTLEALNRQFGGAAQAEAATYQGRMQQLSNSFGDFTEQIGFVFTQNQALIEVIGELRDIFDELENELGNNQEAFQRLVADGIIVLAQSAPIAIDSLAAIIDAFKWMQYNVALARGQWAAFRGDMERADELAEQAARIVISQNELRDTFAEVSARASIMADRIVDAANRGAERQEEYNRQLEEQSRLNADLRDSIIELSEEELARVEQGVEIHERLLEAQRQAHLETIESLEEHYEHELELLQEAKDQQYLTEEQFQEARTLLAQEHADKRTAIEEAQAAEQERINQLRIAQMGDMFSAFSQLTALGGRRNFQQTKALSLAAAKVEGFLAVTRALANPPGWPLNAPAVAAAGARTAATVARIQSSSPPGLRRGMDSVPGIGFQDNFPAILAPKERVVPAQTNQDLTEFLKRQDAQPQGSQEVRVIIEARGELMDFIDARIVERERLSTGDR